MFAGTNEIVPNYRYWSPWVCPAMVHENLVINTEAEQVPEEEALPQKLEDHEIDKEMLMTLMSTADANQLRTVCISLNVSAKGAKK